MKILYFDCFNALSENLMLSAFIDMGASVLGLKKMLEEISGGEDFEIISEKITDGIFATKAYIKCADDKDISQDEALEKSQSIKNDTARCCVVSAVKKLSDIKLSQFFTICACIFAYLNENPDLCVSSKVTCGKKCGYDVLNIMRRENVPYKISDSENELAYKCGVALVSSLSSKYGMNPLTDIIKTGYGTDGENYFRIVLGSGGKSADYFEMSLEFSEDKILDFAYGECK